MPEGALPGKLVASHEKTLPRSVMENAFETNIRDLDDGVDGDSVRRVLRGPSEGAETALVSAVVSKGITELLQVAEPGRSSELAVVTASAEACGVVLADRAATPGESQRIIGLRERYESNFPSLNSSLGSLSSACARCVALSTAPASARVCPGFSFLAVSAAVAHTHVSILHGACHNSCSDTGGAQGPEERKRVKDGVTGPAEDLRPVSEVEAGVNFRPAGGVRQVVGSLPGRQPGTGTRRLRDGAVTLSLHPEVPSTQFASTGPHDRGLGC